jgi:hypothetical protein
MFYTFQLMQFFEDRVSPMAKHREWQPPVNRFVHNGRKGNEQANRVFRSPPFRRMAVPRTQYRRDLVNVFPAATMSVSTR